MKNNFEMADIINNTEVIQYILVESNNRKQFLIMLFLY